MNRLRCPSPALLTRLAAAIGILAFFAPTAFPQPYWPQFRGPNGQGISPDGQPPIHFGSTSNRLWSSAVSPGLSSPVIWGERLILTTYETGRLGVVGFDRRDGRALWTWAIPAGPVGDVHASSSPAAPSAAADATQVYAYFGSWGLVALTHDGSEVWRQPMPPPKNRYGMASSPVLHGTNVVLTLDSDDGKSRIAAFRRSDGVLAWETERPGQRATWSTPALWTAPDNDRQELVLLSGQRLAGYDPRDGRELWTVDGFPQETVSVPAIGRDLVFAGASALGGRPTERYDAINWRQLLQFDNNGDGRIAEAEIPADFRMTLRPDLPKDHPGYAAPFSFKRNFKSVDADQDGAITEAEWNRFVAGWEASSRPVLMAVRPGTRTDAGANSPSGDADRVVWKGARGLPEMPSMLLYRDRLYLVRDGGVLTCLDPHDGRLRYQERLGPPGQYCASPVAAADRIYFASVSGSVTVVDATSEPLKILAINEVGEAIQASPAIAGATLYVRTASHLMAFGTTP